MKKEISITISGKVAPTTHMDTNAVIEKVCELIKFEAERLSKIYLGDRVEVRVEID